MQNSRNPHIKSNRQKLTSARWSREKQASKIREGANETSLKPKIANEQGQQCKTGILFVVSVLKMLSLLLGLNSAIEANEPEAEPEGEGSCVCACVPVCAPVCVCSALLFLYLVFCAPTLWNVLLFVAVTCNLVGFISVLSCFVFLSVGLLPIPRVFLQSRSSKSTAQ